MTDFVANVDRACAELFSRGELILVAVSGGVDSMVLLHVLHRLAPKYGWRLTVAHLNHKLRGRSSDADQRLVERAAKSFGLNVVAEAANVRKLAAQRKTSMEMAARSARHEFLARVARKNCIKTIALAHHADDQVELFFLRLFRGSGPEGLRGMKTLSPSPVDKDVKLARPLLSISRAEIEKFARNKRIGFREDASNRSVDILRNRIRHKLLPYLERDFQRRIRDVVRRTIELLSAESEYVQEGALDWLKDSKMDFSRLHVAVQRRALQLQLIRHGIAPDFDLIEWLRKFPGQPCSAAVGQDVHRDRSGLVIVSTRALPEFVGTGVTLSLNDHAAAQLDGVHVSWRLRPAKARHSPCEVGIERFDVDVIGTRVVLRHWQRGDRFQPIGMTSSVKLQDLFGNLKVSRAERHQRVLAVTESGEIFWVEGLRISEKFKLTPQTRRVLEWKWRR